jgi:hypothetical protein
MESSDIEEAYLSWLDSGVDAPSTSVRSAFEAGYQAGLRNAGYLYVSGPRTIDAGSRLGVVTKAPWWLNILALLGLVSIGLAAFIGLNRCLAG